MRLSPSGRRLAWVSGLALRPPQPMVMVRDEDWVEHPIEAGHSPRWLDERTLIYGQHDASIRLAGWTQAPAWAPESATIQTGNSVAAGGGRYAVSRTDPVRILTSWGPTIHGAAGPAISDDGVRLAYVVPDVPRPHTSTIVVEEIGRPHHATAAVYSGAAPMDLRFGGTTLTWSDSGRLFGIADVSNPAVPVVELTPTPGESWSHCQPVWHGARGELWLIANRAVSATEGEVCCVEWGSVAR